jgi:transcriptional regulator with XRE-family HTH domain
VRDFSASSAVFSRKAWRFTERFGTMVTGAQVRMARAFLRWSAVELAEKSGVGISTINRIEADNGFPASRGGNIEAVHNALVAAGITFLPEDETGMGIRGKPGK